MLPLKFGSLQDPPVEIRWWNEQVDEAIQEKLAWCKSCNALKKGHMTVEAKGKTCLHCHQACGKACCLAGKVWSRERAIGHSITRWQGWGQLRNWNWNWYQFQFQFQELELQRNWIKGIGIGIGIGIGNKELKELIQFLFLIVNSFWLFCYVFQDFSRITWLISSQALLNTIHKNIIR